MSALLDACAEHEALLMASTKKLASIANTTEEEDAVLMRLVQSHVGFALAIFAPELVSSNKDDTMHDITDATIELWDEMLGEDDV